MVVDRGYIGGSHLHRTCDEYSSELASIAAFCCDKQGKAHHRTSMHGYDDVDLGFLFISSLRITDSETRGADDSTWIRASAIRQILTHSMLSMEWSLAVYYPEAEAQMKPALNASTRWNDDDTREQVLAKQAIIKENCQEDARQFFRAGFRQITPPSMERGAYYHLFAVPEFVKSTEPMLTHEEAYSFPIVEAPPRPLPPMGVDRRIQELLQFEGMRGVSSLMAGLAAPPAPDSSTLEASIQKLVNEGGDIGRSYALHHAAGSGTLAQIDVLLKISGPANSKAALNTLNEEGHTPLMIAARSTTSNSMMPNPYSRTTPSPVGICADLIARGADKGVTDLSGLTALGHMRKYAVELAQFGGGYNQAMQKLEPLTKVLMPLTGPTMADNAALSLVEETPPAHDDDDELRIF